MLVGSNIPSRPAAFISSPRSDSQIHARVLRERSSRSYTNTILSAIRYRCKISALRYAQCRAKGTGCNVQGRALSSPRQLRSELIPLEFNMLPSPHVASAAILTEGADIPNIDCVLIARPTRSRNVFAQMVRHLVLT